MASGGRCPYYPQEWRLRGAPLEGSRPVLRIALLTFILMFLALSMLYRAWRVFQALKSGKWSMRGAEVLLADRPKIYWRIVIMNGVTLAISLCAAVVVLRALLFAT